MELPYYDFRFFLLYDKYKMSQSLIDLCNVNILLRTTVQLGNSLEKRLSIHMIQYPAYLYLLYTPLSI